MCKQAAIGFLVVTLLLATVCTAQRSHSLGPANAGMASISGRVVSLDGHPTENARVEVRDALSNAALQSAYTNSAGQFEIANVAAGRYLVVATSGLDEASATVQVAQISQPVEVILRLPRTFAEESAGNSQTVSVQQMKVPSKARSALKRAKEALAKQRFDEAWKEVGKALSLDPTYAEALVFRGILKLEKHDAAGARADMEEAVKDDPGYPMGYLALGATYNSLSRFDDALRVLDRGVALAPNSWQGHYEMGKAYVGKGDFQAALRQLDKAQQLAPDTYAPLHLVKAHALLGLKAYNEAVAELEAYLTRNPKGQDSDKARDTLQQVRAFVAKNGK
jgi:Tfp pilus assembly protein PilF